jgi:VCBS repeat-containing protein
MSLFMLIDGRNGGSTDAAHPGWFEIDLVQFSAGRSIGAMGNLGAPAFSDIVVVPSGLTAVLLSDLVRGTLIPSVRIREIDDATGDVLLDLRLGEVRVTGDTTGGSAGSALETMLGLNYQRIGLITPEGSAGFDRQTLQTIAPDSIPLPTAGGPDVVEAVAPQRYYLLLGGDGNPDESPAKAWLEVGSVLFGASVGILPNGQPSEPGLGDIGLTFQGASPGLFGNLVQGTRYNSAQIQGVDSKGIVVYDLRLSEVVVSGSNVQASTGAPASTLNLSFARVGLIVGEGRFGYDRTTLTPVDPGTLEPLTRVGPSAVDAPPVTSYFLALEGFNGGSVDTRAPGWFEIETLQIGGSASVVFGPGGPSAPPPQFSSLSMSVPGFSPALLGEIAANDGIGAARVVGLDAKGGFVYELRLADVFIASHTLQTGGGVPSSSLVLDYGRIGLKAGTATFGFNLATVGAVSFDSLPAANPAGPDVLQTAAATQYILLINEDGISGGTNTADAWFPIGAIEFDGQGGSFQGVPVQPRFSELKVDFSGASPDLLARLAAGTRLDSIQIQGIGSDGGKTAVVYDLRLGGVSVTGNTVAATSGDVPAGRLTFAYDKVGLIAGGSSFGRDLTSVTPGAFDPLSLPNLGRGALAAEPSPAAPQFYLAIDGLNGGSLDVGAKGWFEIDAVQFGASSVVPAPGQNPIAPAVSDVSVSLRGISPAVLAELATHTSASAIDAVWIKSVNDKGSAVYDLRLGDVFVTGYSVLASGGGAPTLNLGLSYRQIGFTSPAGSFGFDRVTVAAIDPDNLPAPTLAGADVLQEAAVTRYVLAINDGSAPGSSPFPASIPVNSLQFGGSLAVAAGNPQRLVFSSVEVGLSDVLPPFLGSLATGATLPAVQVLGLDGKGAVVYELRLGDAFVTGNRVGSADGGGQVGSLSFAFDRLGLIAGSDRFGYDLSDGQSIDPDLIPVPALALPPAVTPLLASTSEDGPSFSQNLLAGASDPNPGTTLTVQDLAATVATTGSRTLTLGTDYTLTGATLALTAAGFAKFDSLAAGQSDVAVIGFRVSDGSLSTANALTLTVQGVDDQAVLGSAAVTVPETNAPITAGGTLSLVDPDSATTFVPQPATAGRYGAFAIGADGQWSYRASLAYDYLNPGQSLTDTFQVRSTDGGSTSVSVTIAGTAEMGTVRLGSAPAAQTGTGGQWALAWTQTGYAITHKADITSPVETWTAVRLNGVSAQSLAGGDISSGDLGVSGQSAATSLVRQEIDGKEALRIDLPVAATSVTVGLTRLFTNDDGTLFSESGLLRLINGSGQVVAQTAFRAEAASGIKTVTLGASSFVAIELLAGAFDGNGLFVHGGYSTAAGGFGGPVGPGATGALRGSDYLLDFAEFTVPLVGMVANSTPLDFGPW